MRRYRPSLRFLLILAALMAAVWLLELVANSNVIVD
jgi:hypothetical protein